ncbi:MAG: aminoglycoside phosphotransferase family protein [Caloramator sp.]|nr:aminoglycoside phosphotransferase family protein [Caloramator sp.]
MSYDDTRVRSIIRKLFAMDVEEIRSIGHYELNRHYVYYIRLKGGQKVIFKIFGIKNRMPREIASLSLLKNSTIKCPKYFRYGILDDGNEWMIYEYIEGEQLDKLYKTMTLDELKKLFFEIGQELGKIHSYKTFDFFGDWDEKGKSIHNIRDYYTYFVRSFEIQLCELMQQNMEEKRILIEAAEKIKRNFFLIESIKESRLCHNDFDGRNILIICQNGEYKVNGIVDFEQSFPGNIEMDIVRLYFRYFLENKDIEKTFFEGYNKYISIDEGFFKRLDYYLLRLGFGICCWTYYKAPEYYKQGLELVKKYINKF